MRFISSSSSSRKERREEKPLNLAEEKIEPCRKEEGRKEAALRCDVVCIAQQRPLDDEEEDKKMMMMMTKQ